LVTDTSLRRIERLHAVINRSLFLTTGTLDYDRITAALTLLANTVDDHDCSDDDSAAESLWAIGEHSCSDLADMITGAFWHFTEWHAGQWSDSYAALSALGGVFSPGMSGPETDNATYLALEAIAS
jgi:hypothetical protein